VALVSMNAEIDLRPVLPAIRVPTLIIHRADDRAIEVAHGRYLAAHIPGATYVEPPGIDHLPFVGDADGLLREVEGFLGSVDTSTEHDRVLATILDLELRQPAAHEPRPSRDGALACREVIRQAVRRFRGRPVGGADRSVFAFDGPARAIGCAVAIASALHRLGAEARAGLHTGECEHARDGLTGLALRVANRVAALAAPGEILVSGVVADLVAGSGIAFDDRGLHVFDGIPGRWRLFAVDLRG
jgi:class 3 adenylate cyclase